MGMKRVWVRFATASFLSCAPFAFWAGTAKAADHIVFGTNWLAEGEHGGFYQALATGIYAKYGLDVEIRQGGPQLNHAQLLAAGRVDFNLGAGSLSEFNYVQNKLPLKAVAAIFQREPIALIAHPGEGNDSLDQLRGKPILIGQEASVTWWNYLKVAFGYTDSQIRPYTFNLGPFLADQHAIQQGYATSEPFAMEQAGVKPVVMLLADRGFNAYSTMIETTTARIKSNPDQVQRFVDASILGWISYLHDDPSPANALIKKANPEMTDALLAFTRAKLNEYHLIEAGDALALGVGAMTEQRWSEVFVMAYGAGLYPQELDWQSAYTLQFVNKKLGLKSP
jgi:NitT/TauT family transport system substrate-binding protein